MLENVERFRINTFAELCTVTFSHRFYKLKVISNNPKPLMAHSHLTCESAVL